MNNELENDFNRFLDKGFTSIVLGDKDKTAVYIEIEPDEIAIYLESETIYPFISIGHININTKEIIVHNTTNEVKEYIMPLLERIVEVL